MKKILTALAFSVLALSAARAVAVFTPVGPVAVNFDAIVRQTSFQQVGGKTNQSNTSTNITQLYKATVTHTNFHSADLVALIANSFNTNFPAGSQVGMRFANLYIVDSTGTNIIFTPSGVISFPFDENFISGAETQVTSENASGTQVSGMLTETFIGSATMMYDDTLNTTTDGTHTKFAFKGLYTLKFTENLKTRVIKTTTEFDGTGGGPVRDVQTILTGAISGKATGVIPSF